MKKKVLLYMLAAGLLLSVGCSQNEHAESVANVKRVEEPKELFDPEEAFSEIPHDYFKAEWMEGESKAADGERSVYKETYDFELSMDKAVIPYTVSGKVVQTYEYSPSEGKWNVERHMNDVIQEVDLSTYRWRMEDYTYVESFVKTGPNTFAAGKPDHPTEPYFTVDILAGGCNLKDEEGQTNLPGGQWTARLYIEFTTYPKLKGEAAIDLISGSYGYAGSRWTVPLSELRRVEKERNMTDEDRAKETFDEFHQTFTSASSFEIMDQSLVSECNRQLESGKFGNVGVEKAAVAKDRSGALIGWVVQSYSEDSFGGDVVISTGFNSDGSIDKIEFLTLQDTPGLGMKAKDDAFKDQFSGKRAEPLTVITSGDAGNAEIDAISGATVTSNAVTNAVNAALHYVHNFTGKKER